MLSQSRSITLETPARQEFFDVTQQLDDFVRESGVNAGVAVAYSPHTSCCVLLQEESEDVTYYGTQLLLQDTLNVLARIAPPTRHEGHYLHPRPTEIAARRAAIDCEPCTTHPPPLFFFFFFFVGGGGGFPRLWTGSLCSA